MHPDSLFKPTLKERLQELFSPRRKQNRLDRARRHLNSLIERYDGEEPARERKNR
jgi:hypothetical protein